MDRLRKWLPLWLLLAAAAVVAEPSIPVGAPRLVSLAPHITELLFAAGAGPQVVGVTAYSNYPPEARELPQIGDAFRLDYERIVSLHPDLAVAWESGTPQRAIERLQRLGLRVVPLSVQNLDGIAMALEQLGQLAGTQAVAYAAARKFRNRLAALRATYAARPPLRIFVELDEKPLYTVNGRHPISELLAVCGGRNVFDTLPELAAAVDLEAVIAADPQAILYTGPAPDPAGYWQGRVEMTAVRDNNILQLPPDLVSRATPRVLDGAQRLCEALESIRARDADRRAIPPGAARGATAVPAPAGDGPAPGPAQTADPTAG